MHSNYRRLPVSHLLLVITAFFFLGLSIAGCSPAEDRVVEPPQEEESPQEVEPPQEDKSTGTKSPVPMQRPDEPDQADSAERLLASPPANFKLIYQFNNSDTRIVEFVPNDESDTDWNTRLTFESHAHLVDSDPIEVLIAEVKRLQDTCNFVQNFNLFSGFENGYPTSVRLMMCGTNLKLDIGEVSLTKVIQATDYLYLISVTRRVVPFEIHDAEVEPPEIAVWSNYLSHITVCDESDMSHPCAETTTE